jgi:poly(3-hydroxybutyrate) depolymerase
MLATYPELFAGGAITGGLPYGVASGVAQAFERMQGRNGPTSRQLRSALSTVRRSGPLPKVSIWHGTHDQTVRPVNAEQIADQWRGAHGTLEAASSHGVVNGHTRTVWTDADGREVVELYLVKGMAHGVPLAMGASDPLGQSGPFMLDAGISSTARIAEGWGLVDAADVAAAEAVGSTTREPLSQTLNVDAILERAMSYVKRPGKPRQIAGRCRQGDHRRVAGCRSDALSVPIDIPSRP